MPINHEHRAIFIHIPKSGGTSVHQYLKAKTGGERWDFYGRKFGDRKDLETLRLRSPVTNRVLRQAQHLTGAHIKGIVSDDVWNSYFKFAVVRNSWDRIVSYYEYARQTGGRDGTDVLSFKEWFYERNPFPRALPYIQTEPGKIAIDYVIRFEKLVEGLGEVCAKTGIPFSAADFPHAMKTKRKHYTEYYDDDMRKMVADRLGEDIEFFKFRFEK
ncbi:sulfotransferase family 2 domain-containing protein [Reyranella sp.]|uniref:sulfotransferase family 2 domain-containing protein n=1 Tax=Reyranella sp. TaxID=1929291 RepID=UPI003BA9612B